jgi:hypothetical protein
MAQQPKFRGFSTDTNTWRYGFGWFEVDYTEDFKRQKNLSDKACLYTNEGPVECELDSMGAYSGIKDVIGKGIYANDIIEVISEGTSNSAEVIFDDGCFCLIGYLGDLRTYPIWNFLKEGYQIKVIGNSIQNPEKMFDEALVNFPGQAPVRKTFNKVESAGMNIERLEKVKEYMITGREELLERNQNIVQIPMPVLSKMTNEQLRKRADILEQTFSEAFGEDDDKGNSDI